MILIIPQLQKDIDTKLNISYSIFVIYQTLSKLLKLPIDDFVQTYGNRIFCKTELSSEQIKDLQTLSIEIEE